LERWKGHIPLLHALSTIKDRDDWTCWIAGGPQRPHEHAYFQEMQSTAANLGIQDRVRFLGQRTDVHLLMQAAEIFCQPNTGPEPFGVVFIEALYSGLPVVATSIGGPVEIITPSVGRLVEPNNPDAVSRALGKLLSDDLLRKDMATKAPFRARELCGFEAQLSKLRKILHKLKS
jgi:glycosyltransferase involved in cell wall biosynthesis